MIDISKLLIEIVNSLYSPQTVTAKQRERTRTMLWFNNRKKVEALYYEWIQKNGVADTPMSLIAFMQIKGWLNEEKILEEINKPSEAKVDNKVLCEECIYWDCINPFSTIGRCTNPLDEKWAITVGKNYCSNGIKCSTEENDEEDI